MSVKRLRLVVGVVTLSFVLALVLGSAGLLGGGQALGAATSVTVIGGDVQVRHGATGTFVAATDGEVLTAGDAIRTSDNGRAVLTYFEGSTVTVEPSTQLTIEEAAAQHGDTRISMTQDFGRTWHVVTKLVTGNSKYEVRTPASTASVRGTEFQVDTTGQTTTVTTTEGTVVDQVPDPANPGQTVDVPVPAGEQHTQPINTAPAPIHPAPPPDHKVTVTVGSSNSLIVDPLGRANGITPDGRVVVQTPGAQVRRDGDSIVITLPNLPDGRVGATVDKTKSGDLNEVNVTAVVELANGLKHEIALAVPVDPSALSATTGIALAKQITGDVAPRVLSGDELKVLAKGKIGDIPTGTVSSDRGVRQSSTNNGNGPSGGTGDSGPGAPPPPPGANTNISAPGSNGAPDVNSPPKVGGPGPEPQKPDEANGPKVETPGAVPSGVEPGGNVTTPGGETPIDPRPGPNPPPGAGQNPPPDHGQNPGQNPPPGGGQNPPPGGGQNPPPGGGQNPPPRGGQNPPPGGGQNPPPGGGQNPPPRGGQNPPGGGQNPPGGGQNPPPDHGQNPPPDHGQNIVPDLHLPGLDRPKHGTGP